MPRKYLSIIDKIREQEDTLSQEYWDKHSTLTNTQFSSRTEQYQEAAKLGQLSEVVLSLMKARSLLMNLDYEVK